VAGEAAPSLARSLQAAGSPPIGLEADRLAVLGDIETPDDARSLDDLPTGSADFVVLRRAWESRPGMGQAVRGAFAMLRPGGCVVVAEIDAARLLEGPAVRYPDRVLYDADPGLAGSVRVAAMERTVLAVEMVRAGFRRVAVADVEVERGRHASAADYWQALASSARRPLAALPAEDAERLIEEVAGDLARLAPLGPVVDREPWLMATGGRP
jgi:hypothetical protein